ADRPLPEQIVSLASWTRGYYQTPLGLVWQSLLPSGIQKQRRIQQVALTIHQRERTTIMLNEQQQAAIDAVQRMSPGSALLHGVTGSGKPQVYIELAKRALARGKSAVI